MLVIGECFIKFTTPHFHMNYVFIIKIDITSIPAPILYNWYYYNLYVIIRWEVFYIHVYFYTQIIYLILKIYKFFVIEFVSDLFIYSNLNLLDNSIFLSTIESLYNLVNLNLLDNILFLSTIESLYNLVNTFIKLV